MTRLPSLDQLISLKGKRALITGAAAGIGKAIAYRFGEAGADLELADIDPASLPRTTDELSRLGVEAGVIALTRALAKEHARPGFRVNAIVPGGIITHRPDSA